MSEKRKIKPLTEQQQLFFKQLHADRIDSARIFDKPSIKGAKAALIEKYSEQAHFIYELLQNADDAKATKVRFVLTKNGLIFAHNGTIHFSISDVANEAPDQENGSLGHINAITSIAQTTKTESEIGKFGIGFKSVFQYTDSPEIYDPPFYFKIEQFFVPTQIPSDHKERKSDDDETLFYFPFNSKKKKPDDAYSEITIRLKNLNHPLLFLKNLKHIAWKNDEVHWNYSKEEEIKGHAKIVSSIYHESNQKIVTKFLIFERQIPSPKNVKKQLKINIAFKISSKDSKKIDPTQQYSPFCFFETHERSELRFIIQAPFVLNNSREGLKEKDPDNGYLIQNIANLLGDSLPTIKDLGYLSIDFFEVLPLPTIKYLDPILYGNYKPLFEIVLKKMKGEDKLLPTSSGDHVNSKQAIVARGGKDFIDLLGNKQLEDLCGTKDSQWLDSGINEKNEKLWLFFTDREYLGIKHIRPEDFTEKFSKQFIEKQSDDWVIKFYSFLIDTQYLVDKLKNKPYIRIQIPKFEVKDKEIDHVEPFEFAKKPRAFLPIENQQEKQFNDFFPIVKANIVQNQRAKQFLEKLGLTAPDEFAAISQVILPKYLKQPLIITDDVHKGDIEKIAKFLKIKRKDLKVKEKLDALQKQMQNIPFFYARNCDGKLDFKSPQTLYLPHQYSGDSNLEQFFERNPNIWFLEEGYQKIPDILQVVEFLEISTRPKISKEEFQDFHTYKKGFTQDYLMEGLEFLFKNKLITLQKSLYLWQLLLKSQKDPQYKIEFSGKFEYANDGAFKGARAGNEVKYTTIFNLLTNSAWVPNNQLEFEYPSKVREFHTDLERLSNESKEESKTLFQELKFFSDSPIWLDLVKSIIPEETMFNKIKMASELPEEIIHEAYKKYQETLDKSRLTPEQSIKYTDPKKELREFFNQPQRKEPTDFPSGGTPVSNSERRRENTAEDIQQAYNDEPPESDRISLSVVKKWDGKNPEIRTFLRHEYEGKCQICSSSFNQKNGDPYFEGAYMIPHTKGAWLDRPGSVLCLCPTCCAKILHGSVSVGGDIVQQILDYKLKNEGGIGKLEIPIMLCGKEEKLQFSEKHILDLQEILKIEK